MPETLRSYLYASAARPEVLAKACFAGADAVVFDLEDSVHASRKDVARARTREAVREFGGSPAPAARPQIHVRINHDQHGYSEPDLDAVVVDGLSALRLPRSVDPAEIEQVGRWLDQRDARAPSGEPVAIYPTVESAAGVANVTRIAAAHPRVARIAFGVVDFLADIGVGSSAGGAAVTAARGQLVLHSRAAGIGAPVDGVHTAIDDDTGLRASALRAWEDGFSGKSVIHPHQLAVVHQVFSPSAAELVAAEQLLAASDMAAQRGEAALLLDGGFVDPAVTARARALLDLAAAQSRGASPADWAGGR
ncbi:MAG: HpcH/HpaI aldolase/citrate lyase family protein [Micromonosporaceae bacterium]